MQIEAIASCPIASYLGEETNTCLTTTSSQVPDVDAYSLKQCVACRHLKQS